MSNRRVFSLTSVLFVSCAVLINLGQACEYREYDKRLKASESGINLAVHYQYPYGLTLSIYRDNEVVQEILSTENLGKYIDIATIPSGLQFIGDDHETTIKLTANEKDFAEFEIFRELRRGDVMRDCIELDNSTYWYGGPEQKHQQYWPIERQKHDDRPYTTLEIESMAIVERYWLNSKGIYYYIDENTPLFITQKPHEIICFKSAKELPYNVRNNRFTTRMNVGVGKNPKEAHMKAVEHHLGKPTGIPDELMVEKPIWSTWARYGRPINQDIVKQYAQEIVDNGFENSQIEIDDFWEDCYGSLTINTTNFPSMKDLTTELKQMGFRVTMWIHPFINKNCQPWYDNAKAAGYLMADHTGNTDTSWWNSGRNEAAYIDFTNPKAMEWWVSRIEAVREESGVDNFKFDAGETSWGPNDPMLQGEQAQQPTIMSQIFTKELAKFGRMIEVRTGWKNQEEPIFFRMLDKDSYWSIEDNGLQSLIPTLLQMNLNGYPFVLPDMIGGNGYQGAPSQELWLRWLEANVFMPTLQFSFVPWDYDAATIAASKSLVELHKTVATPVIIAAMNKAVADGTPVNPPIWWIAPEDKKALSIGDQFLLGETIIVAPLVEEGKNWRTVYLPEGTWLSPDEFEFIGPIEFKVEPIESGIIPFFVKKDETKKFNFNAIPNTFKGKLRITPLGKDEL